MEIATPVCGLARNDSSNRPPVTPTRQFDIVSFLSCIYYSIEIQVAQALLLFILLYLFPVLRSFFVDFAQSKWYDNGGIWKNLEVTP